MSVFRPSSTWLAAAVLMLGVQAGSARAALLDPATLFIGNGGTCPSGGVKGSSTCGYLYNGEVSAIGQTQFDINLNGNAPKPLVTPLLAILGVPNTASGTPVLTSAAIGTESFSIVAGASAFGLPGTGNSFSANGLFEGNNSPSPNTPILLTSSSANDVYSLLGLTGNGSNSFTNWSAADKLILGLTNAPTSFSIYVFSLTPTVPGGANLGLTNNDLTITYGSMPEGTFVVAYGQDVTGTGVTGGEAYSTPFTQAGFDNIPGGTTTQGGGGTSVPEPASVALLAFGLFGLALVRARPSRQRVRSL
jgi:PEP-CTERM motif